MDEKHLIQTARGGDLEAFNTLIIHHQDAVYQRALWLLGDKEGAEDATQEAFLKAYRKLSQFRGGSLRAWLLRIVTNLCYDELQRRKTQRVISLFDQGLQGENERERAESLMERSPSIEAEIERRELQHEIYQCLEKLPQEYRETLFLVDILDLSYEETASILLVPVGTVKSRLARACWRMQEQLRAGQADPVARAFSWGETV